MIILFAISVLLFLISVWFLIDILKTKKDESIKNI